MNKNIWSLKLNTVVLVLIPVAVGINYMGKVFSGILKLPLWLDSIGTVLAALLAGPIVGGICGAINNIIYGLTIDPTSVLYALSSIGIGVVVGVLARLDKVQGKKGILLAGLLVTLISVVISTPINMICWGGQTGNIWGDTLFVACVANHIPTIIASALDELVVDFVDKFATVIISYGIFKGLPQKLILLYRNNVDVKYFD